MGRDKALLDLDGTSLLERAVATVSALGAPVVLAAGPADRYAELGLERVLDRAPGVGPLAGLAAVLERAASTTRERDGLACVLACDMPRARTEVLERLLARAEERGADACLLETDGGVEPLFAVYRLTCLEPVRRALQAGERRMIAFHRGYGELSIDVLPQDELPADLASSGCARNLNTPAEFRAEGGSLP